MKVVDSVYGRELVPGAIPTPRLAEKGVGEAYFVPNETTTGPIGVWYAREPGYESPDGRYFHVRVVSDGSEEMPR